MSLQLCCYVFLVCALARVLLGGCILEQDKELTQVYIIFWYGSGYMPSYIVVIFSLASTTSDNKQTNKQNAEQLILDADKEQSIKLAHNCPLQ